MAKLSDKIYKREVMAVDRRSSFAVMTTGLVVGIVGLLNVALGIIAVKSGAFPSAGTSPVAPPIGVGSIFFGLLMMAAGALWVVSGVGYFTRKEWASTLALYVAPAVGVVNVIGVLNLWGFTVGIGWAALSTVSAMGSFWYISRKELASFFLISVAEHVVVVIVFAMLVYAEPVDTAKSQDESLPVTIAEMDLPEPVPPEIIPQRRAALENQPVLPKIKIQDITATDRGTEIEGTVPLLPKTVARISDPGATTVLRSPGRQEREQRYQDTVPKTNAESVLKTSKKPSLEIGPSKTTKDSPETTIARPPENPDDPSTIDDRLGPSDDVARPSFAGKLSGEIAGRKVVSWPKPPEGYKGTGGGSATIKFWVDPAGRVTNVKISKKSGSPRLDTMAMDYVWQIRFVALPKDVQHKTQEGTIPIDFELAKKAG